MSDLKYYYAKLSCPRNDDEGKFLSLFEKLNGNESFEYLLENIPNNLDKAKEDDIIFIHIGGDSSNKRRYFKDIQKYAEYQNGLHCVGRIDYTEPSRKEVSVTIIGLSEAVTKEDLYFFPQFINNLGASTKGTPNQAGLYELDLKIGLGLIQYLYERKSIETDLELFEDIIINNELYTKASLEFKSIFKEKELTKRAFKSFENSNLVENSKKVGLSEENPPLKIKDFEYDCTTANLTYKESLITRYIASLVTKPFVLLSGLSGSGKTKLAQSFAQWICEDSSQYCIVPVGADWTNREPLLGYVNALKNDEYILPENGALQLLIDANNNLDKPHFLILDEMNLSHVERYFADFLSVMESKDGFKLHSDIGKEKSGVPHQLAWPKNLFVVGTVNIDETTYMFSPKVLDRANVIEFRVHATQMKTFLKEAKEVGELHGLGKAMGSSLVEISVAKKKSNSDNLQKALNGFFEELQKVGAEFGYRTASEIQTLFGQLDVVNPGYVSEENKKIDIAMMQKLLPKLHGSRRKLLKTLEVLAQKCLVKKQQTLFDDRGVYKIEPDNEIKFPLSFEKIARMYKNAIENGFASYAEA